MEFVLRAAEVLLFTLTPVIYGSCNSTLPRGHVVTCNSELNNAESGGSKFGRWQNATALARKLLPLGCREFMVSTNE